MTEEAQQRAMAEACGKASPCGEFLNDHSWPDEWRTQNQPSPFRFRVCTKCPALHIEGERFPSWDSDKVAPSYNTLDAMHEAEKILTNAQRRYYMLQLNAIHPLSPMNFLAHKEDVTMDVFHLCHTKAHQRREAFLKTLGRWVE